MLTFTFAAPLGLPNGASINTIKIYESENGLLFNLVTSAAIANTATSYNYAGYASRFYKLSFADSSGNESGLTDSYFGADVVADALPGQTANILRGHLYPMIGEFQRLGVADEPGVLHQDGRVRFTYPRWNRLKDEEIRLNGQLLTRGTHYTLDAVNGQLIPITTMTATDDILARYYFAYFSDGDLLSYLNVVMSEINAKSPGDAYTTETADLTRTLHILIRGAYVSCIRKILMDNLIWKNNLIWADAQGAIGVLQGLLAAATAEYKDALADRNRRQFLQPHTIRTGRYGMDYTATGNNFFRFTVLGT